MAKKKHKRRVEKTASPQLVESIYKSGLSQFKQGEYEKAVRIWGGISNDPKVIKSLTEAHFRNAMLKYKSKDEKDVISELYRASKYSPDQPLHLFHIGLAFHRMSKLPNAINFYTRAINATPEIERYRYHLGLAYLKNGEIPKSIETFETIKSTQGKIGIALVHLSRSDYDRALEILNSENSDGVIRLLKGLIYLKKGEEKEAKPLLKIAADNMPENGVADYYLGLAHARTGAIPSAVKTWEDAIRKGSDISIVKDKMAETYRQLVPRYFDKGSLSKVVKIWEKILEIDQEDTEVRKNLVHAYFIRGNDYAKAEKFTYAIKFWEKAWELDPKNIDIAHNLALAFEKINEPAKASKYWREAAVGWKRQISSSNPGEKELIKTRLHNVHIHLADIAMQEDKINKAILECIQAIRYNPDNVKTIQKLASLYIMQRRYSMAIKQLLEARRLNPTDITILQELTFVYAMNHDVSRSIQCVKEILKIDPDNKEARWLITNHYINNAEEASDMGKHSAALRVLLEGLDVCPDSVEIQAKIGSVYLDMDDIANANSAFQEAIAMKPAEPGTYIIVARNYLDKEMLKEAEEHFKKAIDLDKDNHQNYINIAIEYCEYDMFDLTHKYLEKAKNIRKGDPSILEDIIKELLKQEFSEQAVKYADELIKIAPDNPKFYHLAAEAYHINDENKKALNILEKGMKIASDNDDKEALNELINLKRHIEYSGLFGDESLGGLFGKFIGDLDDYDDFEDEEEEDY